MIRKKALLSRKAMTPKIPLGKSYFNSDELEEIQKVLDSGWVTQGPKVKEFESKIVEYLGIRHAIAVTNCTSALHLSLLSIGIKKGDEVLVADYTYPATGHAVLYCGAKPVFVDIDLKTYNMDADALEAKTTDKTRAIIPVHAFGQPAEMDKIARIANKYNLKVIEDAACAFGARYRNKFAGTIGDIGCFSLHGRKGITTGEGGILVTNNNSLAEIIRRLALFGINDISLKRNSNYKFVIPEFTSVGYNYKMSDITAAVGIAQLRKLQKIIKKRQALAAYWDKKLLNIKFITPPHINKLTTHVFQSYVALLDEHIDRNSIIEALMKQGLQTNIGTYSSHIQPVYNSKDKCPNSLSVFKRALALPIFYTLSEKDIDNAAEIIKNTLER